MRMICALVVTCCLGPAASCFAQETGGIGVAPDKQDDRIVVRNVLPDGPAASSNQVKDNDRLLAVGQGDEAPVNVGKLPLTEVVRLVRGPKGSTIRLTLAGRDEKDPQARVVSLVRGELKGLARWGDGKIDLEAIKAYHVNGIPMIYVITADRKVAAAGHALDIPGTVKALLEK